MQEYVDSLKKLAEDHGMPKDMWITLLHYADTVGAIIMAWSKADHYLQTRGASEYTVMDTPGRWVPTPPAYSAACRTTLAQDQAPGNGQLQYVSRTASL